VSAVQPHSFSLQGFVYWLVLGIVLFAVLYPAGVIIFSSFETPGEKLVSGFGLQAWKIAFADPAILSAIWNTLTITLARQAIALPIAILLAWVIARTDVPGATTLEFLFWLGYFLPPLPVTMGWILLLDPDYGVLNRWLTQLPFVTKAPFNIYSFWGIVWAHLTTSTIAVEVMLLTPAFRNMDATLEEASLVSGAGVVRTITRIVVPLLTPIVGVVLLLGIVRIGFGISISFLCFQHADSLAVESTAAAICRRHGVGQHDIVSDGAADSSTAQDRRAAQLRHRGRPLQRPQAKFGKLALASFCCSARDRFAHHANSAAIFNPRVFHGALRLFQCCQAMDCGALEPGDRGFGISRFPEKYLGAGRRDGARIGGAVHTDRLHRYPHQFCRPRRSRLGVLVALYSAGNHSRFGTAVRVSRHAVSTAVVRIHVSPDRRDGYLEHDPRCSSDQRRVDAVGGGARRGGESCRRVELE